MDSSCVDSAIEQLYNLLSLPNLTLPVKKKVQILQLELKFIKLFFSCSSRWKDADETVLAHLGSLKMDVESTLASAEQGIYEAGYFAIMGIDVKDWDLLTSNLLEKVGLLKPGIRQVCVDLFDCSMQSMPSLNTDGILEFIDSVLMNLKDLVGLKDDKAIHVKKQIPVLQEKLRFSRNFLDFTAKYCSSHGKLNAFLIKVQSWTKNAACLSFLYWVDGVDVDMAPPMNIMLKKIMPCTPEVAEMYLELLKSSESSQSGTLLVGKIVVSFVDFLLENPKDAIKDHVEILYEGLVFCLSFLMDPPTNSSKEVGNVLSREVDAVITGLTTLICSLNTYDKKDEISKDENILLLDFLQKINNIQAEVRELDVQQLSSLESSFPKISGIGFIDNLLNDLEIMKCEGKFIPFANHKVAIIRGELMSWRPFVKEIVEQQNAHQELKDLWTQILKVAYQAERVISSCLSGDCHVWLDLARLANVVEKIQLISCEVIRKVESKQIQSMGQPSAQVHATETQISEGNTSKKADEIVGFNDEANAIVQQLKVRSKRLCIVSIVGMAGVGKSTLARKVYTDRFVPMHFTKHAWCFVSQAFRRRDLLHDILMSVTAMNDSQISSMKDEDLAERLRKSLKGEKYLIVFDNIWDIRTWDAVKDSLPDDGMGNKILFTTQNQDLASQTGLNYANYPLSTLSPKKSWEFLEEKLFGQGACPKELKDIGEKIATSCKGLPLAIVVTAGLLTKEKTNQKWWIQIGDNLDSGTDGEGYMKVLEISYKHLPNSLKPCFLYLGAFGEGEVITVRKLAILWIAEGFVERNKMSSEIVAKNYLMELINRSLVIVTKRSSHGGIKACRVHDLLRKLCMEKAKEERFLHSLHMSDVSPHVLNLNQYRLCIYAEWETLIRSIPTSSCARSLLLFTSSRWNQSYSDSINTLFFHCFKLLKVLDMESIYLDCSFPEEIFLIVQLTYLAIRGCITRVPSSVTNLWNLETLVVRVSGSFVHVPLTIWKMKSLKHVDISPRAVISFSDIELEELPRLDNVEAFSCLSLYHGDDTEKLLSRLSGIRRLRCVFLESQEYIWKGIQFPNFTSLDGLESLKVSIHASDRQVFCSWMRVQFQGFNLASTLKKLTLYNFGLPWRQISTICKLENLEVLKLRDDAFRGKRCDMQDLEFPELKFLELSNLDIEQWEVSDDTFTSLERLVIGDCYSLEKIPSEFGQINTMKLIELRRCSEDVRKSAMKIRESQHDLSNLEFDVL